MITILTPTYNRAHTLSRLFKSLCDQENKDFEWVVVDDGSVDETKNRLDEFCQIAPFDIKIVHQENSGKHVAVNAGVVAANSDWIFIVDSDDALENTAISFVYEKIKLFPDFVGYCFRKKTFAGALIGSAVAENEIITNPTKAGNLFKGDLAYIFLKSSFLSNPFPTFLSEKFVPELYIWNKISDFGEIIFFPKLYIYICDYLDDGYSKNFKSHLRRNPNGFGIFYKNQISRETNIIKKIKCFIRYSECLLYRYFKN